MRFPLNRVPQVTEDSNSFACRNLNWQTEIPTGDHVGAFGKVRSKHVHEGIDLYVEGHAVVYAMVTGRVVSTGSFTGEAAHSPWWNTTQYIAIEDDTGVWFYGEIETMSNATVGRTIYEGEPIGRVIPVLKINKGRPTSMLHLERYERGVYESCGIWELGTPQPHGLLDPTPLLITASKPMTTW